MASSRPSRFLWRHLCNLLAPGLVFLPSLFVYVQSQGYPQWRPEVLITAGLILAAGLPIGLLLSLRPRTFGAAAMTLLLFAWLTQVSAEGVVGLFAWWDGFEQSTATWAGHYGGMAIGFVAALLMVAVPLLPSPGLDPTWAWYWPRFSRSPS